MFTEEELKQPKYTRIVEFLGGLKIAVNSKLNQNGFDPQFVTLRFQFKRSMCAVLLGTVLSREGSVYSQFSNSKISASFEFGSISNSSSRKSKPT